MRILILLATLCFLPLAWSNIQFEEVSEQAGITRIGESWGNAWGDFDGDGYLDLWATNHKHKPSLYRNNGDGTFTDIIDEVWNANPYADTHGVAWADFDNDGDQDLIVLSGSGGGRSDTTNAKQNNHFYVNREGQLVESASELGVALPILRGRTPLWIDWNNDRNLDLLLTGILREDRDGNLISSFLLQQTQIDTFTETCIFTKRILAQGGGSQDSCFHGNPLLEGFNFEKSAAFAQLSDITGNGNMDLIIASGPYPGTVLQRSDTGQFQEVMESLNFPKYTNVQDAVFADFNGDLLPDVFLARDVYRSYINRVDNHTLQLYIRNNQGETGMRFSADSEVYFEIYSVWEPRLSLVSIGEQGYDITQFNGEFVGANPESNVASFKFQLSPTDPRIVGLKPRPEVDLFGIYVGYNPNTKQWTLLYHKSSHTNNWTGFEAIISARTPISNVESINFSIADLIYMPQSVILTNSGPGDSTNHSQFSHSMSFTDGRSVAAGDFDNDMDLDLYLVRSSSAGNLPNHLYENRGDGTFVQLPDAGQAAGGTQGRGQSVTMADYDRDGYLDLFVTNGRGAYPFNEGPDQLFRNIGSGNNWLQIDLQGTVSNRDGIGARLFVKTPDGKIQLRENGGGIHWAQQDQKRIHFGLAQNQTVQELTIHWPSGSIQELKNVSANQVLRVVESEDHAASPADVNADNVVDIRDLIFVVEYIDENPLTNARADVNKDNKVDIEDLVWIIKAIEATLTGAAPSKSSLSETDTAKLYILQEKIEEMPANSTEKELVKHFLRELLRSIEGYLETKLHANYPNPFNPETWIPYQLAEPAEVSISIHAADGKLVRTLALGQLPAGIYRSKSRAAYWDGKNALAEAVASGVYFYTLTAGDFTATRKMIIRK